MPRQKSDHVDSAEALAARLREARLESGLSQRALARGICTPAYVSRLEKGERIPSLQLLRRLAERLGADADELASGIARTALDPLLDAELALRLGDPIEAELESAIGIFQRELEAAGESGDTVTSLRFAVLLANALIDAGSYGRASELLGSTLASSVGL